MSHRVWKGAVLALHFGALLARTGGASCANDVGKARSDRLVMHCERVNTSAQPCADVDCSTLSSLVQAFCATPKGRPALCSEYPALVVSKTTGIPPDLERIAGTAAEDRQVVGPSVKTMENILTLVTSLSGNVKASRATVSGEQRAFTQHATLATATHKRYKAAVDSKSAAQLAVAPKLMESARKEFDAASSTSESLLKHVAELREQERQLTAAVLGGDRVAREINLYATDAKNAELVVADALTAGVKAHADAEALAHVKALRAELADGAKETGAAATQVTQLAQKIHTLAEMRPGYDPKQAEAQAAADDEALKKKIDDLKQTFAGLSGTTGNLCDRPMLERSWKPSSRTTTSHTAGLVPVVFHSLDAQTLGRACPFLKGTVEPPSTGKTPSAAGENVDIGFVPFADLGLELLVLVHTGAKCGDKGCPHTFFVKEGQGGFAPASNPIPSKDLAGFERRGVDIFALLTDAEWKLRRTPGKPAEFVFLRSR